MPKRTERMGRSKAEQLKSAATILLLLNALPIASNTASARDHFWGESKPAAHYARNSQHFRQLGILYELKGDLILANKSDSSGYLLGASDIAELLTQSEIVRVQIALTILSYYNGLIDGVWGKNTAEAVESFRAEHLGVADPVLTFGALSYIANNFISENKLEYYKSPLHTRTRFVAGADWRIEHKHEEYTVLEKKGIMHVMSYYDRMKDDALLGHEEAFSYTEDKSDVYVVRRKDRMVTSFNYEDSDKDEVYRVYFYARSDQVSRGWESTVIFGSSENKALFEVVAGSITQSTVSLYSSEDRALPNTQAIFVERFFRGEDNEHSKGGSQEKASPIDGAPKEKVSASGSGFFINDDGMVLTNYHVIEDCTAFKVNGFDASLRYSSEALDLAILMPFGISAPQPLLFAKDATKLNQDVTIAGFPYFGLLGGLAISRGAISGERGLKGDARRIQISASVQPGNSGGPVVDVFGNVVGVVVSKLNALTIAKEYGDIPQNINFAISGEVVKAFLRNISVDFSESAESYELTPTELADKLKMSTALIQCDRS